MAYGFTITAESNAVQTMKQIEAELNTLGVTAKTETKEVESSFVKMGEGVKGIFGGLKKMLLGGLGIAALFEGWEFVKEGKEKFDALEESTAKINAALASTKGIAGESREELEKIAKANSGKTLFGRAAIMDAESMLLTFTQIRGEIYSQTIPAIEDFATRFKMDLPEAANMLGKALNDPLKGMTRLQRQGVVFNDQQKENIKKFMETGQIAKAQKIILQELSTEFGGLAQAMTKTDEGKVAMAKKQWGEIKLTVGELVSKLEVALIPVLSGVIKVLKGVIDFFKSTSTTAIIFKNIILSVAAAFLVYQSYLAGVAIWQGIVTAAQWLWNAALAASPITWIILLIVALAAAVMYCWDKFKTFREIVGGVFGFFKQEIMTVVHVFQNFAQIVDDIFHGRFKKAFEDGKKMIADFRDDVTKGMIDSIKKGAEAAGNSEFKFSNLLKLGGSEQSGPTDAFGKGLAGKQGMKDSAINTSNLSGASGGLGQAKIINIKIDTMQKVVTSDNRDLKRRGQDAVEVMARAVNNLALSQGTQ